MNGIKPEESPQGVFALAFANVLVAGEYDLAHTMLSEALQVALPATQLAENYEAMIDYGHGRPGSLPDTVEVMEILNEWPTKRDNDVGWAYVAISSTSCYEAVDVVVAHEQGRSVVRELGWGRP